MVPSLRESSELALVLGRSVQAGLKTRVSIHPPFSALTEVKTALAGAPIALGAQDVYWEEKGAYTGEVSTGMLKEAGCEYVIIGHSERRRYFGETDETASRKVRACAARGLVPILCVGETMEERKRGQTLGRVESQLRGGLQGLPGNGTPFVIAYEPVWAIGTGVTPTPEEVQEVHAMIRRTLSSIVGSGAGEVPIQYGGSVTPENASTLLALADVNGALVGGASLKAEGFMKIIRAAEENAA